MDMQQIRQTSPHLFIYSWQFNSIFSILYRISSIFFGFFILSFCCVCTVKQFFFFNLVLSQNIYLVGLCIIFFFFFLIVYHLFMEFEYNAFMHVRPSSYELLDLFQLEQAKYNIMSKVFYCFLSSLGVFIYFICNI